MVNLLLCPILDEQAHLFDVVVSLDFSGAPFNGCWFFGANLRGLWTIFVWSFTSFVIVEGDFRLDGLVLRVIVFLHESFDDLLAFLDVLQCWPSPFQQGSLELHVPIHLFMIADLDFILSTTHALSLRFGYLQFTLGPEHRFFVLISQPRLSLAQVGKRIKDGLFLGGPIILLLLFKKNIFGTRLVMKCYLWPCRIHASANLVSFLKVGINIHSALANRSREIRYSSLVDSTLRNRGKLYIWQIFDTASGRKSIFVKIGANTYVSNKWVVNSGVDDRGGVFFLVHEESHCVTWINIYLQ